MNPVLLKPQAGNSAQLVVCGKVLRAASAREYRALAPSLLPTVLGAFARVAKGADLVLVEGAGSPAEINLRPGDIANKGFAEAADLPVALVGDIDRGGVIAQLVRQRTRSCPPPSGGGWWATSSTSSAAMCGCSTAASPQSANAPGYRALEWCGGLRRRICSRRKTAWR